MSIEVSWSWRRANPQPRSEEVQHEAGRTWQVADVKRPLMSVAKMVAAGNRVHLDSRDPRIVRPKGDVAPLRKAEKRVRH